MFFAYDKVTFDNTVTYIDFIKGLIHPHPSFEALNPPVPAERVIDRFANLIQLLCERSPLCEFPEYIRAVLESAKFKILCLPIEAAADDEKSDYARMGAKYLFSENTILVIDFHSDYDFAEHILPSIFWSVYKTILNNYIGKSIEARVDAYRASSAWNTIVEMKTLNLAIQTGDKRIVEDYKNLKAKIKHKKLSPTEQLRFDAFQKAALSYSPRTYVYSYSVPANEGQDHINLIDNDGIVFVIGLKKQNLYPLHFYIDGSTIHVVGMLVKDKEDKSEALIRDTLYCIANKKTDFNTIPNATTHTYADISDLILAANVRAVNKVFYPERFAYHSKRIQTKTVAMQKQVEGGKENFMSKLERYELLVKRDKSSYAPISILGFYADHEVPDVDLPVNDIAPSYRIQLQRKS